MVAAFQPTTVVDKEPGSTINNQHRGIKHT